MAGGARSTRVVVLLSALLCSAAWSRALAQGGPAPAAAPAPPASPEPDAGVPAAPGEAPAGPAQGEPAPESAPPQGAPAAEPPAAAPVPSAAPALDSPDPVPPSDADMSASEVHYLLERVRVEGNKRTKVNLILDFVPLKTGESFDVDDPEIQALRYRLLGSGWFDRVELSLERGRRPGWVVLVIRVEERQTLVFQQLAAGVGWSVAGVNERRGTEDAPGRKPEPYLGLSLAETNFLGTGTTLGGELLVAPDQQGFALNYLDPFVRKSRWSLNVNTSFVNGQEYFGGDKDVNVSVQCDSTELSERDLEDCQTNPLAAVVDYWRAGLGVGTARDVGSFTRLSLGWHGDYVYVPPGGMPTAASEVRGNGPNAIQPILFSIEPYSSIVSMLSIGLTYDKRDSAALPTRGLLVNFTGDLASALIGSSYQFVRLQTSINHWTPLGHGHTLRFGAYAGSVFGRAPFFYKFFVTDLTDLMPSRILGLNLDHRPAPNLFGVFQCGHAFDSHCGTSIAQMRIEDLAARIDAEYVWALARGRRKFLRSADVYALIGLYALANQSDLKLAVPGYSGIARLPIDLTFDVGFRLDTKMGVFQIGLAKIAWLPVQ